ncbi:MBL fold metallo-hydrolase [Candidatus Saccharibacteria bacterium]|nr:MBL fold metallo-hydrolase [Candidatus Saccharibacteria bacterium]
MTWLCFLVAFVFAGFGAADVFAETGVSDVEDATITIHVLGADEDKPDTPDDPEGDPDPSGQDDPVIPDDTPVGPDVGPSDDEGPEDEIDDGDGIDRETDDDEEDLPVPNTSGDDGDAGSDETGLAVPDTGGDTNTELFGNANGIVVLAVVGILVMVGIVVLMNKRRQAVRKFDFGFSSNRGSSFRVRSGKNIYSSMGFDGTKNKWLKFFSFQRIAGAVLMFTLVIVSVCVFNSKKEESEEASAAGFDYPYTISVDENGHYDIYVRQGEYARAAFAIRTSTDNLTGYTLSMSTEKDELANASDSNAHIQMVNDGTTADGFTDNKWGFSTDGTSFGKLPKGSGRGKLVRQTKGASAGGNSTVVYFAAKIANDLPVGDYAATLHLDAETNPVYKVLTIANGNVAKITKSDGSVISSNSKVLLGEELNISNSTDAAGILQTVTVNGQVNNNSKVTVTGDLTIGTEDDSLHFLRNDYEKDSISSIGDAILIKSKGKYWLVDTGRVDSSTGAPKGETVAAYLKKLGIKYVDYVLITHIHGDHRGGVPELVRGAYINDRTTVYIRGCEATQTIADDGTSYTGSVKTGCTDMVNALNAAHANVIDFYNHEAERASIKANGIDFGNFKMTMFNIDDDDSDGHIDGNRYRENLNSIGMKLEHKVNHKTAFLAADWEWGVEDKYGSSIGQVDILKAGHHGGKTSNTYEFIKALNPKTMVLTSRNVATQYGNPNRQAAAWAYVEQRGGTVYFTGSKSVDSKATDDAVSVYFDNSSYSVKKGVDNKHDIMKDANTYKERGKQSSKPYVWDWDGGTLGWYYPKNKTGSGGKEAYTSYTTKYYVYVYKKLSSYGNILAHVDRCGTNDGGTKDGYYYTFKTSFGDGVSKGRTSKSECK